MGIHAAAVGYPITRSGVAEEDVFYAFPRVGLGTRFLKQCLIYHGKLELENNGSQAGTLIDIHKYRRHVISAWMPKSSVHGRQTGTCRNAYRNRQITVHGLDTGIPAGMTAYLYSLLKLGAWEPKSASYAMLTAAGDPHRRQTGQR